MFLGNPAHPFPRRIISLVPSITELLADLGLQQETIAITKFCVHPEAWFRTKTRIGGTKTPDIEKIKSLNPDLIIANKEENIKDQVEQLSQHFPVWLTDVNTFKEALAMIRDVGSITGKQINAGKIAVNIQNRFGSLEYSAIPSAYLIWKDPYMTVGGDTFINDMMQHAGFKNVFADHIRYPEVTVQQISESKCQLLFLSSEPYPFKAKHVQELQAQLPHIKIITVDGEMFSWYGSRMVHAASYFRKLQSQITP